MSQRHDKEDSPINDIFIGKTTRAWANNNQFPVVYEPSTESTQTLAKNTSLKENDFQIFLTDFQTHGKGRGNNLWQSEKGRGLMSTWSFYLNSSPVSAFTSRVGLAVWRALSSTWSFIPFALKAPNDIYVQNKKLAGILVETVTQGSEVVAHIGLGVNVLKSPDLPANSVPAVCLLEAVGHFSKAPLLGEDWIQFLNRLFIELTEAVSSSSEKLSTTDQENLCFVMNRLEGLKSPVEKVLDTAEFIQDGKKIPWYQI